MSEWDARNRVYFIACGSEFVKIGFSDRVASRVAELGTANPLSLELLAVIEGDRADESALHVRFAALRHAGEWFRREGELAALLDSPEAFRCLLIRAERPAPAPAPSPPAQVIDLSAWVAETERLKSDPAARAALREECRLAADLMDAQRRGVRS